MNPDARRWGQVCALLDRAAELPEDQRRAFLEQAVDDDATLVAEVLQLLDTEGSADRYFEGLAARLGDVVPDDPAVGAADDSAPASPLAPQPKRLGPYRILRELGRGGMGVVYLAERADGQFEQQVAIKLLPAGVSHGLLDRFLAERQILARLEHPAIARLFDGGLSAEGSPYFVMEYVDGIPIDRFADAGQFDIEGRLQLLLQVAEAAAFAHRRLVVHRDLKPDNILVDSAGQVKLLDFGVAKLLDHDGGQGSLTVTASAPLTPAYAAPEQIRGEAISTATDVYALGVLTSRLLCGRLPYPRRPTSPTDLERLVCEEPPRLPARRLADPPEERPDGSSGPDIDAIAAARGTTAPKLRRRLVGDLDAIVDRALRKEPERRYGSVDAFARDLRRHLASQPVEARKGTLGYRVGRFARRHRRGVAIGLIIAGLLIGLGVVSTVLALSRTRQAARIADERDRAQRVVDLLVDLFEVSDPTQGHGETVSAKQLLDFGSARVRDSLSDEPAVQAQLSHTLGRVYHQLGMLEEARPLLEEALALRGDADWGATAELSETLAELGRLETRQAHFERAVELLQAAVDLRVEIDRGDSLAVADLLLELAHARSQGLDPPGAEVDLRRALAIYRAEAPTDDPRASETLMRLGTERHNQGDFEGAVPLWEQAAAAWRTGTVAATPAHARALLDWANYRLIAGEPDAGTELFDESERILREVLGTEHPDYALALTGQARCKRRLGFPEQAVKLLLRAEAIQDRWDRTLEQAATEHELAAVLMFLGRFDEAEPHARLALELSRRLAGGTDGHFEAPARYRVLGTVQLERGEYAEAERLLIRAIGLAEDYFGPTTRMTVETRVELGRLHARRGETAQAETLFREAAETLRASLRPGHPMVNRALVPWCRMLLERGRADEAWPLIEEVVERAPLDGAPDAHVSAVRLQARGLRALGRPDEARARIATSLAGLRERLGENHPAVRRLADVEG